MPNTDRLRNAAANVSDKASQAAAALGEGAVRASEELATQVAGEARTVAEETIATRKARAERYLRAVGTAVHAGCHSLEQDGLHATADCTRQAANIIDRMASNIEDVDIRSAAGRVEAFMRARPALSFGAALLLGFTAYQLLASGSKGRTGAETSTH
jgi:hypothetical protein